MMTSDNLHKKAVKDISIQLEKFYKENKKIRIYHGSTNSTRAQKFKKGEVVDTSLLSRIISINEKEKYALVESNVSMDLLVEETLKYNLIPPVVMEFPGITVGGGVQGGAGESSSFKWGLFHKICLEYEIVLGNGEILRASPKKNPDLFFGTIGSYGSLGIITLIKIKLIPAKPFVHLAYNRVKSFKESVAVCKQKSKEKIDFIDGILFSKNLGTIITGRLSDKKGLPIATFNNPTDDWHYVHAEKISKKFEKYEEIVPIKDYFFRYNRGAFWVGKYVFIKGKIPFNKITRFILEPLMQTRTLYRFLQAINISQGQFVQDLCLPEESILNFLEYCEKNIKVYPIWLCPGWAGDKKEKLSPGFIKTKFVIDVGVWGKVYKTYEDFVKLNQDVEKLVHKLKGRKVLYAHAYYSKEDFWKIYDKKWYENLREKYFAEKTFPDVYEKTHVKERYKYSFVKGFISVLKSPFKLPVS